MKLSTKIIIGSIVVVLILWGLELLVTTYFMDQFGQQGAGGY